MENGDSLSRRSFMGTAAAMISGAVIIPDVIQSRTALGNLPAFTPDIGVCTSIDHAKMLRLAGVNYIEESVGRLLIPDKPKAAFEEKLKVIKDCSLPITAANGFLPGSLKCVGPNANHDNVLSFAETAFIRAAQVGIAVIVFGSSRARSIPQGIDRRHAKLQFVALLGKMAMIAQSHDITIAIEPLNKDETNFINTVEEGAKLVRAVQHPNIMLLADIYHMLREDEPAENIRIAGDLIRHVHIAERKNRAAPGVNGENFSSYFQALSDIDYNGKISIECRWKDMVNELPTAVRTMQEQMSCVN